jgi:hypothetical protein
MSEFRLFNLGGKTLMKWREPNAYSRKRFPVIIVGFTCFLCIGIVITGIVCASKSHGQFTKNFLSGSFIFFLVYLASITSAWFLPSGYVRLKESCVQRRSGRWVGRSNYDEIESAAVRHEKYKDQKYSIIHLKLKGPKPWINISVNQIIVPQNVNLEQALQIFRGKDIKVIEKHDLA